MEVCFVPGTLATYLPPGKKILVFLFHNKRVMEFSTREALGRGSVMIAVQGGLLQ